jgi:creatinine amidohydrolase
VSPDAREVQLRRLAQPELASYAASDATVLIPVGAIEQHGPHLPVEMDVYAAEQVSAAAAREFDDVLVAPSIPWGLSHAHVDLGGTISIGPTTMLALAADVTETLLRSGFRRQVWINGHHGNKPILALIVYEAKRRHGLSVGAITYYDLAAGEFGDARQSETGGSGHACEFETSLLMHLSPDAVGDAQGIRRPVQPRTPRDFRDLTDPGQTAIGYTFAERFPEGIMGDPTVASPETGERIWEAAVAGVVEFLADFRTLPPEGVTAT